jgi:hypothetical protein
MLPPQDIKMLKPNPALTPAQTEKRCLRGDTRLVIGTSLLGYSPRALFKSACSKADAIGSTSSFLPSSDVQPCFPVPLCNDASRMRPRKPDPGDPRERQLLLVGIGIILLLVGISGSYHIKHARYRAVAEERAGIA